MTRLHPWRRRRRKLLVTGAALVLVGQVHPAAAQDAAPPPASAEGDRVIIVTGTRGSAIVGIAPIAQLDMDAIAAIGAQSVDELNRAIQGQSRSADGAEPIFLLNAQRVSGYQEIQSLPPEAIEKIEILPEPAALRFGFPPTRRLVNYITKRRFAQLDARAALGTTMPTGRSSRSTRAGYTRLRGDARLTANLEYTGTGSLLRSERDVAPDPDVPFDAIGNINGISGEIDPALSALAGTTVTIAPVPVDPATRRLLAAYAAGANRSRGFDPGANATLVPANDTLKAEAVLAMPVGKATGGSLTATLERSLDRVLGGPAPAPLIVPADNPFSPFGRPVVLNRFLTEADPLRQRDQRTSATAGATLRGALAGWQWDAVAAFTQTLLRVTGERGIDLAAANAAIAAGADPFAPLPPGLVSARLVDRTRQRTRAISGTVVARNDPVQLPAGRATITATLEGAHQSAASRLRGSDAFDLRLARGQLGAGLAFDLPLTSRAADVLPAIGDLSLNASANRRQVARFGTLTDSTLGLAWTPLAGVQVLANLRRSAAAPDLQQLSTPPRAIDNVPIFDFASGRTEIVTLLLGGNPDLRAERRRTGAVSLTWQPWAARQLRIAPSYEVTTIRDQTGTVFATTPRVEALLPGLFVRDTTGRLQSVAFRPVNFAWQRQRKLQLSLTASGRIGTPPPPAAEGAAPTPDERPSYYMGAVPILALEDRLQPSVGSAFLDLLDGDSIGTFVPRWSGYAYGGVNAGGYGGTFSLYYGGTRRIRSDDPAADLTFLPILQLGFTAYLPVDDLLPAQDWTKGLQLRLEVADLLDSRQRVRDANGQVPNRFQTDLISPLGRIITMSLRQRF